MPTINKSLYSKVDRINFKDAFFETGFVKFSQHKNNNFYLLVQRYKNKNNYTILELTELEVLTIIELLSKSLMCKKLFQIDKSIMTKLKWWKIK